MVYLIGAKQNDLKSIVLCSTHSIHIYTFFGYNSRKQKSVNNLVTSKITIINKKIIIIIIYYYNPILYNKIYINTMKKNNKNKIKKEEERRRRRRRK